MAKLDLKKLKKPTSSTFRGWTFVLVTGVLLAILAMIDRGGVDTVNPVVDGSTGCQLTVEADLLNVRSGPSAGAPQVTTFARGALVDGTTVATDGFRQLKDGNWASSEFLTPTSGSNCG